MLDKALIDMHLALQGHIPLHQGIQDRQAQEGQI
jgi:hypothetical protein